MCLGLLPAKVDDDALVTTNLNRMVSCFHRPSSIFEVTVQMFLWALLADFKGGWGLVGVRQTTFIQKLFLQKTETGER
jgi:hypothetical protein